VALLALIAAEAREHARRRFLARSQGQWVGQVVQVVPAGDEVARGAEALDRARVRQWGKHGDRAAAIGDLDRLAGLDTPQQLARPLPELTHAYRSHVLVVAHRYPSVELAVAASCRCSGVAPRVLQRQRCGEAW
jgi:hypothetical protein